MKELYFDFAATTKVKKKVLEEMLPYFMEYYGNPSSIYSLSRKVKSAIDSSKKNIAKLINSNRTEIYFTSGGTEADNWAVKGIALANREKGKHIITTEIEHAAILNSCKYLQSLGFRVTYLPVDKNGFINLDQLRKNIDKETILVSIMWGNNEIGTVQNIKDIGEICKQSNVYFHTDAVQALGQIPIDVKEMNIDLLSMSAHKIYGPKGIGALYIKKGVKIHNLIHGGEQERGRRSGTENVPGIVGFGKAAELTYENSKDEKNKLICFRDKIIKELLKIDKTKINGATGEDRLPNNINVCFEGVESEELLIVLDTVGIFASAGSACSAGAIEESHVLKAIGLSVDEAKNSIRFTIGYTINNDIIEEFIGKIKMAVNNIRQVDL
ncbi:cysteine desulfurase family protein [Clostridium sediminicola]|uniref:cysteine desulfurase family protein n=1 Tax=Clostridium sediminicola TaxID=3114879 RepID=UPI0031F25D0D